MKFDQRISKLPTLGIGLSTEYGAMGSENSLDLFEVRDQLPHCANFLELGVEVSKGFDHHARRWIDEGGQTTYHFLDLNLNEPEDFDSKWIERLCFLIDQAKPAWLCGDAGVWHFGPRAQGHMLLLPPILNRESAYELADGVISLRESTGLEVFPENPPGHIYIGDLHILDFFAIVCDRADTGMLLDAAHLAIFQHQRGHHPTTGLDAFPLDRVIELHMAGGSKRTLDDLEIIEDDHSPLILPETWEIFNHVAPRLTELRAVVFECERNPFQMCKAEMERLYQAFHSHLPSKGPLRGC